MTQRPPRTGASAPRAATDASGQADAARPPGTATSMQRSWPPRRLPALLAILLLTAAVGSSNGFAGPAPAARPAQAEPVIGVDGVVRDPRAWLLSLAGRLQPTATDDAGGVGAGNCLHVQRRAPAGHGTLVVDSLRWITPDGGGVVAQTQTTVPAGPGDRPVSNAQIDDFQDRWPAPVVSYYGPGALVSPVGDPVPADADVMTDRIAARIGAVSADLQDVRDALVVAVLADLVAIRYLDLAQRAAVLQVLAGLPTLAAADAGAGAGAGGGGGGAAFRVAAGAALATFVVDAATGSLLRYQTGTGADQTVIRFSASRCDCPRPQPRWSTSPWFQPPVLIQPADAMVAAGSADTAVPGRPTPRPRCLAGTPRVRFVPVTAPATTEAPR